MKKVFGIVLAFSFVFVLSGCSTGKSDEVKGKGAETKTEVKDQKAQVSEGANVGSNGECLSQCISLWKTSKANDGKSEEQVKNECNSLCDAGKGIQNQDINSCDKAEGIMKDTCYNDIAKNSKDPSICDKITSGAIAGTCYINAMEQTKDKSYCEKIKTKMFKDDCLSR
jgi:protein involved in sex pheromone biosynthesis